MKINNFCFIFNKNIFYQNYQLNYSSKKLILIKFIIFIKFKEIIYSAVLNKVLSFSSESLGASSLYVLYWITIEITVATAIDAK